MHIHSHTHALSHTHVSQIIKQVGVTAKCDTGRKIESVQRARNKNKKVKRNKKRKREIKEQNKRQSNQKKRQHTPGQARTGRGWQDRAHTPTHTPTHTGRQQEQAAGRQKERARQSENILINIPGHRGSNKKQEETARECGTHCVTGRERAYEQAGRGESKEEERSRE
ncbi:hypothetical protein NEAUS05_2200 [Nematocida ausubeli]|nr:hypothetical protein NEAUS05_2200 [Nematocida ausubeli]